MRSPHSPVAPVPRRLTAALPRALWGLLCSLLIFGSLTLPASAQIPPLPRFRPKIPTLEAAKVWDANRPRPIEKVLVKLKPGVSPQDFGKAFSQAVATKIQAVRRTAGLAGQRPANAPALDYKRSNKAIGWHVYRLGQASDLPYTLEELKKHPMVEKAEPDYRLKLLSLPPPNDTYWNREDWEHTIVVLSTLANDRASARELDSSYWTYSWTMQQVNALEAFAIYPGHYHTAAERINLLANDPARLPLVAVIDSGLDMDHPDLGYSNTAGATNVVNGGQVQRDLARSFTLGSRDPDPELAFDEFGHGTSVTGIIAAAPNNRRGIVGLGFPARIVPIKVIDGLGNGDDSDLIDAMTYAADIGCLLINASLTTDTVQFPESLQEAVDYCWNKGTLVIAGIGNDGTTDGLNSVPLLADTRRYPAACVGALAVSATSYAGLEPPSFDLNGYPLGGETKSSYSNANMATGVCAPGGNVSTFSNLAEIGQMLGLDPLQQYVMPWTLAPTYQVALSDPDGPYGSYAFVGLYGLDYGAIQGTSFSCPHATALAALYAASKGLAQAPGVPQMLINALQKGALGLNGRADGGWDKNFGYGRIDAYNTLLDLNARGTNLGGFIGQVTVGGTVVNNVNVVARNNSTLRRYSAVTFPDGIYHMVNLPAGTYTVTTAAFGYRATQVVEVEAGCDLHGVNFRLGPEPNLTVTVTPKNKVLPYGGQQQYTATVMGTDETDVLWSLPVDAGATIDTNGLLKAPKNKSGSQQALVKATSLKDPSRFDTALVTFQPVTITPVADTYVRGGSARHLNYGTEPLLITKYAAQASNGMNRVIYMMFDFSSLLFAPKTATLTLRTSTATAPGTRSINLNLYQVNDTSWTETGLVYNNAPGLDQNTCTPTGALVATQNITLSPLQTIHFDLSAFVAANIGKQVTLQLLCDLEADINYNLHFYSRESANGPRFTFTYD